MVDVKDTKKDPPRTFIRVLETPDDRFKKGTFLPIEFTKDGVAKVIGEPIENPKIKGE